ncbi:hypothetical protein QQF64_020516 [Cirrhinus molitorella]|uniref:Uncharacterized protein n=1 Tax=Cirrhinus molitorella TaxID=172907 RepID=A0ABR3LBR5_9TELE
MSGNMWEAVECVPPSIKAKNHHYTLHQHQPSSQERRICVGSSMPATLVQPTQGYPGWYRLPPLCNGSPFPSSQLDPN